MARLGMAQHFIASSTRRSSSIQSASRISLTALNEFSYVDDDNRRRNEHCLRAQRTENACARERRDCPSKAVFRNPAFDDIVSHHGNLRVDDDRQHDGRKAVNDRRQIRACHSQLGLRYPAYSDANTPTVQIAIATTFSPITVQETPAFAASCVTLCRDGSRAPVRMVLRPARLKTCSSRRGIERFAWK